MTASGARQYATFRLGLVEYPAVRLGAARSVADLAVHQHGLDEIGSKLAEIEAVQRQFSPVRRRVMRRSLSALRARIYSG